MPPPPCQIGLNIIKDHMKARCEGVSGNMSNGKERKTENIMKCKGQELKNEESRKIYPMYTSNYFCLNFLGLSQTLDHAGGRSRNYYPEKASLSNIKGTNKYAIVIFM